MRCPSQDIGSILAVPRRSHQSAPRISTARTSRPPSSWCKDDQVERAGLKGLVVRHRRKYSVTNRRTLTAQEVRAQYRKRQEGEEILSVLTRQLSLEAWQVGSRRRGAAPVQPQPRAQEHHMALCLVASLVVERERLALGVTWRKFKQRLILKGPQVALPALERVRKAA